MPRPSPRLTPRRVGVVAARTLGTTIALVAASAASAQAHEGAEAAHHESPEGWTAPASAPEDTGSGTPGAAQHESPPPQEQAPTQDSAPTAHAEERQATPQPQEHTEPPQSSPEPSPSHSPEHTPDAAHPQQHETPTPAPDREQKRSSEAERPSQQEQASPPAHEPSQQQTPEPAREQHRPDESPTPPRAERSSERAAAERAAAERAAAEQAAAQQAADERAAAQRAAAEQAAQHAAADQAARQAAADQAAAQHAATQHAEESRPEASDQAQPEVPATEVGEQPQPAPTAQPQAETQEQAQVDRPRSEDQGPHAPQVEDATTAGPAVAMPNLDAAPTQPPTPTPESPSAGTPTANSPESPAPDHGPVGHEAVEQPAVDAPEATPQVDTADTTAGPAGQKIGPLEGGPTPQFRAAFAATPPAPTHRAEALPGDARQPDAHDDAREAPPDSAPDHAPGSDATEPEPGIAHLPGLPEVGEKARPRPVPEAPDWWTALFSGADARRDDADDHRGDREKSAPAPEDDHESRDERRNAGAPEGGRPTDDDDNDEKGDRHEKREEKNEKNENKDVKKKDEDDGDAAARFFRSLFGLDDEDNDREEEKSEKPAAKRAEDKKTEPKKKGASTSRPIIDLDKDDNDDEDEEDDRGPRRATPTVEPLKLSKLFELDSEPRSAKTPRRAASPTTEPRRSPQNRREETSGLDDLRRLRADVDDADPTTDSDDEGGRGARTTDTQPPRETPADAGPATSRPTRSTPTQPTPPAQTSAPTAPSAPSTPAQTQTPPAPTRSEQRSERIPGLHTPRPDTSRLVPAPLPPRTYAPVPSAAAPQEGTRRTPRTETPTPERSWPSGVVRGGRPVDTERGRPADVVVVTVDGRSWGSIAAADALRPVRDSAARVVVETPLLPESGFDLAQCAAGEYRDQWTTFGTRLKTLKTPPIVALGPGMNESGHPWSGEAADYAACFTDVARTVKQVAPNVAFQWTPALGSRPGMPGDTVLAAWPAPEVVDVIGVDATADGRPWQEQVNGAYGLNYWASFADRHGKRIAVARWGVLPGTHQDRSVNPAYIRNMHDWVSRIAAKEALAYEAYAEPTDVPEEIAAAYRALF